MNEIKAVFVRHNMRATLEILEDLWANGQIAIHYQDLRSTNPDDYNSRGRKALKRLHQYCESGAMVGVACNRIRDASMLVGVIPKGSKVSWTDKYGENYIYKVVDLQNTREIAYADYPLLAAIQPRLTTITGWERAKWILKSAIFDTAIPLSVDNLDPGQLEVICYEYLRMKSIIKTLLLPIGRNLQNVDIYGIGEDGKTVIAQVTHGSSQAKVNEKLCRLVEYRIDDVIMIFFGPSKYKISTPGIEYVSIEDVFQSMVSQGEDSVYHQMVVKMFNIEQYDNQVKLE